MPAKLSTEISISVKHQPGELGRILDVLSKGGVNLLALCGYGQGDSAEILMVPQDEGKARKALVAAGVAATEHKVVCVTGPSGKGAGAKLAAKLAKAGVNIQHAYATTSGGGRSTAIFRVEKPEAAIKALK